MLDWGTQHFKSKGVPGPRVSIEWLLAHVLDLKRLDLYLQFDRPLTEPELITLREMIKRRSKHEPLQYITGETDFYHCRITVTPAVLIPRPETEELVEMIKIEHEHNAPSYVDAGTGSGCIAIALKKALPQSKAFAFDVSLEALSVARKNAALNEVEISFFKGDMLAIHEKSPEHLLDILVSNPPYVTEEERASLDTEVLAHEPELALFCERPLQYYEALLRIGNSWLKGGGQVWMELNPDYAEAIMQLFNASNYSAEIRRDLSGKKRFVKAVKKAD